MALCLMLNTEPFFFGKDNEPTLNHIVMTEDLAAGTSIPLGKNLLGSVYHMLHQTT
jgi:hypothetical protein